MADPVTRYATIDDLQGVGINAAALRGVEADDKNAALDKASRLMDGYLKTRFKLPLVQVGADMNMRCAQIAAFLLLTGRGFNPQNGTDEIVVKNYDDALRWLREISNSQVTPDVTDSSAGALEGTPSFRGRMTSSSTRGFSDRTVLDPTTATGDFIGD